MGPNATNRLLRKQAAAIGLKTGHSAHSIPATFISTAPENGATLDDAQRAAGQAEPGTTELYDRRGYNPKKSASFSCDMLIYGVVRSLSGQSESKCRLQPDENHVIDTTSEPASFHPRWSFTEIIRPQG